MADVGIVAGETLLVKVQVDPGDPDTLSHPCAINTNRSIDFKTNVTETEVADCADQSKPAKIVRKVKSIDFTIAGAGKVDATSTWFWIDWWQSGEARPCDIVQNLSGAAGGWHGEGDMIVSSLKVGGERGGYQDIDVELVPASPAVWEQNA